MWYPSVLEAGLDDKPRRVKHRARDYGTYFKRKNTDTRKGIQNVQVNIKSTAMSAVIFHTTALKIPNVIQFLTYEDKIIIYLLNKANLVRTFD